MRIQHPPTPWRATVSRSHSSRGGAPLRPQVLFAPRAIISAALTILALIGCGNGSGTSPDAVVKASDETLREIRDLRAEIRTLCKGESDQRTADSDRVMARLDVVFATLGTKQSEQVAAESNRVLRELGDKLNALDGQESARIAAESNKIVGEISRQLAALGSSYADGNAALERRFDSVEGGIASAATEYAESSAALKALRESMESNTESGQKLRAESAAKLAESEFANGRRDRAILIATCAATADPTNPRFAIRLSEMAAQGPDPQPESLDSTVMLLRTLALQSTGEGATQIWDAADRLN